MKGMMYSILVAGSFLLGADRVKASELSRFVSPQTQTPITFCGENVPIQEGVVFQKLTAAFAFKLPKDQAFYSLPKRTQWFFSVVEPILAAYQIPNDFKYIPLVESGLLAGAVSPKGAVGYWQLMPQTARDLGLRVNSNLDERLELVKSTQAACRYLQRLHSRLGSWTLTAAAYNSGMGSLSGTMRRQQTNDYYHLKLNAETGQYLYRILAYKHLLQMLQQQPQVNPMPRWGILSGDQGPVVSRFLWTRAAAVPGPVARSTINKWVVALREAFSQWPFRKWKQRLNHPVLAAKQPDRNRVALAPEWLNRD